jgi:hypothetical protein
MVVDAAHRWSGSHLARPPAATQNAIFPKDAKRGIPESSRSLVIELYSSLLTRIADWLLAAPLVRYWLCS